MHKLHTTAFHTASKTSYMYTYQHCVNEKPVSQTSVECTDRKDSCHRPERSSRHCDIIDRLNSMLVAITRQHSCNVSLYGECTLVY